MSDDRWVAFILAVVMLGMFGIGYGISYLQWAVLNA